MSKAGIYGIWTWIWIDIYYEVDCIIKVNMCYMSVIDPEVKHNILIQKTRVIIPSKFGKLLFKNNIDKFTKW